MTNNSAMSIARSTYTPATTSATLANISDEFVPVSVNLTREEMGAIRLAMSDTQDSIAQEKKWRLLQMILQCSMNSYEARITLPSPQPSPMIWLTPEAKIYGLVTELDRSIEQYFFPTLHRRLRLIELHVSFESQVELEHQRKSRERSIRNRESAGGKKLERLPQSGKSPKNCVLDKIIDAGPSQSSSQRNLRKKLLTLIHLGSVLHLMVCNLGLGVLLALPPCTVHQYDLKLQSLHTVEHRRPIEPTE
jgi:hypothetical protein